MASCDFNHNGSAAKCKLLSSPLEIRTRIYRLYFVKPVVSTWFHPTWAETPLGLRKDIEREPKEVSYRRAIADDFDELDYARRYHFGCQTMAWLEDYRPLLGTCRQTYEEATEVLGPMLHLKLLSFRERPRGVPQSFQRLYFSKIEQLTVMCDDPNQHHDDDSEKEELMCFEEAEEMPNLKCVRIVLPECQRTLRSICLDTVEEAVAWFLGKGYESCIEGCQDRLIEKGHERMHRYETWWWCDWLRDVLFKRKAQRFRVIRREIFDILFSDRDHEEDAYHNARHLIKTIFEFDAITSEVTRRRWIGVATRNGKTFGNCSRYSWDVTSLNTEAQLEHFIEANVWPGFMRGRNIGLLSDDSEGSGGFLDVDDMYPGRRWETD